MIEKASSPYINHFLQPDTLIPDPSNPQAWNRYSYVGNNPVNLNDPTGHMQEKEEDGGIGCWPGELACQLKRSDVTTKEKDELLEENNELYELVQEREIDDLEALSLLSEHGASLTPDCPSCYINNMGAVLTGFDEGNYEWDLLFGEESDYYKRALRFGQTGYASIFQDPKYGLEHGGGNQAHHFWFYVQVGYEGGSGGNAGVILHELVGGNPYGKSSQDAYLGYEGIKLGILIRNGDVNISDVGSYIINTLSPQSPTAQYYQNWHDDVLESLRNP